MKPLTPSQLADRLGCTPRTIQKKARDREIPHLRVGRLIRFTEQHVDQIMQAMERDAIKRRPEAMTMNPVYQPSAQVVPMRSPAA